MKKPVDWNTGGSEPENHPACPKCGKQMRIRLRGPSSDREREQLVTYICECGNELARKEGKRPDVDFK